MWGLKELKRPSNDQRSLQTTRGSSERAAIMIETKVQIFPFYVLLLLFLASL